MNQDQIYKLLEGSYDLHTHPIPSHVPRSLDDFELVEQAAAYKMAGVMIKNHYEPTAARAALANRRLAHLPTRSYGGVVLNWPVGGLNPFAVESTLKMGGRMIWMPTRDAENCLRYGDMPGDFFRRPGISMVDGAGKLLPAVYDIFDAVKKYDAVLSTGHISVEESVLLCKEGRAQGVRMVLTHPEWERTVISGEIQRQIADLGVIVEKNWLNIAEGNCTASQMAANIKLVGAHRVYLATDRGQAGTEAPTEGLMKFAQALYQEGISYEELELMMKQVPASVVGSSH